MPVPHAEDEVVITCVGVCILFRITQHKFVVDILLLCMCIKNKNKQKWPHQAHITR